MINLPPADWKHIHSTECRDEIQSAYREKCELKKAAHPGFVISFDNLDIHLDRKNTTMDSQNKDFHWVNHQMVENRVSGAMLDSSAPKANLLDVCNLTFLPSMEDQKCQSLTTLSCVPEYWLITLMFYQLWLMPASDIFQ